MAKELIPGWLYKVNADGTEQSLLVNSEQEKTNALDKGFKSWEEAHGVTVPAGRGFAADTTPAPRAPRILVPGWLFKKDGERRLVETERERELALAEGWLTWEDSQVPEPFVPPPSRFAEPKVVAPVLPTAPPTFAPPPFVPAFAPPLQQAPAFVSPAAQAPSDAPASSTAEVEATGSTPDPGQPAVAPARAKGRPSQLPPPDDKK